MDSRKATGLDGISAKIIKEVSLFVAAPIADIFNASLLQEKFPQALKVGKVIAVHKKGSRSDIKNYRPITMLTALSKIFERLMFNRLYEYLETNSLLHNSQFGFRKGKSTQNAILKFVDGIHRYQESNLIPIGICYDLSRAFDSLSHELLIHKMKQLGIQCTEWFRSYLSDRPNYFVLTAENGENVKSDVFSNNIGVPQGSILGPLLFIVYVNDMLRTLEPVCQPVAFADDSNALTAVEEANDVEDKIAAVNTCFKSWADINGLIVNENKTATLIFKKGQARTESGTYKLDESVRFLGIEIDQDLRFDKHTDVICKKISSGIFCLKQMRTWADRPTLISTYYALIQSHLSYGILAWGQLPKCRYERILRLQKWAIRIITYKGRKDSCRKLFRSLGILTFPALYIYHLLLYAYEEKSADHYRREDLVHYNLRNKSDFNTERCRMKESQLFATFSYPRYYNGLPQEIKTINDSKNFKSAIRTFLINMVPYTFDEFFTV